VGVTSLISPQISADVSIRLRIVTCRWGRARVDFVHCILCGRKNSSIHRIHASEVWSEYRVLDFSYKPQFRIICNVKVELMGVHLCSKPILSYFAYLIRHNIQLFTYIFIYFFNDTCSPIFNLLWSLYGSFQMIKSRRMRWTGNVASMGETRNTCRAQMGNPEKKNTTGKTWM
jgi:hypothetical protein